MRARSAADSAGNGPEGRTIRRLWSGWGAPRAETSAEFDTGSSSAATMTDVASKHPSRRFSKVHRRQGDDLFQSFFLPLNGELNPVARL